MERYGCGEDTHNETCDEIRIHTTCEAGLAKDAPVEIKLGAQVYISLRCVAIGGEKGRSFG
jgi:hypothetical protein